MQIQIVRCFCTKRSWHTKSVPASFLPLRRKYFLKNCPYGVQSLIKSLPLRRISYFTLIVKHVSSKVNWFVLAFQFLRQHLYYIRISVIHSLQGVYQKLLVILYSFFALAHRPVPISGVQSILLKRNF